MKPNEYNAPEVVEIGTAEMLILGYKDGIGVDATGEAPMDREYVEEGSTGTELPQLSRRSRC